MKTNQEWREILVNLGASCAFDPNGPINQEEADELVIYVQSLLDTQKAEFKAVLEALRPISLCSRHQVTDVTCIMCLADPVILNEQINRAIKAL